jgi:hypothetical protein
MRGCHLFPHGPGKLLQFLSGPETDNSVIFPRENFPGLGISGIAAALSQANLEGAKASQFDDLSSDKPCLIC